MNLVVIISDTFRRDHLGCYGNKEIRTPILDALAEQSVVFDRAYCCSFPTLPCRAELFTGRFVFPYLNWGPLPTRHPILAETLARAGYTTTLVSDNIALCRLDYGYFRGFHSAHRIRGQWYDNLVPLDGTVEWPCSPEKLGVLSDNRVKQYLRNVSGRNGEEDYFAPQVVNEAISWLEKHHSRGPFFLYVDLFDAHEPWDPPKHYVDLYDPDGKGENVIRPRVGPSSRYNDADLKRIRALYAGEVSMVDRWVGKLLTSLDALGRWDDTAVVFLSDHGVFLGERQLLGKLGRSEENVLGWPLYSELSRVPLMIRVPGIEPRRVDAYAHPGDLAPTLLELAGVQVPESMTSASLVPILKGQREKNRDVAVSSWSLRDWSVHRPSIIRTDEWSMVFWRTGLAPLLYHVPSDPGEEKDVYGLYPKVAKELHRRYLEFLRANEAPLGNLLPRYFLFSRSSERTTGI